MHKLWRRSPLLAGLAVLGLIGAACGGGGSLLGKNGSSTATGSPDIGTSTTIAVGGGSTGGGGSGGGNGGGAGGTAPPTTGAPGAAALDWHGCGRSVTTSIDGLQCASLPVPVSYADPHGATIQLALDRVPATGKKIGSLLINPGGPGESGVQFLPEVYGDLNADLRAHFDIVSFDPRGVGDSAPITCGTGPQLDAWGNVNGAPTTPAGLQALLGADRQFAQGCASRSGALLGNVGTVDAARDMDAIRAAVGDARLNYLGFSYGTLLGATYADLFPTRIRAMVLDGAEDPSLSPITMDNTQSVALENELRQFFAWCTSAHGCAWHPAGGTAHAEADVVSLLKQVAARPLPASGTHRTVGPNQVLYGMVDTLYTTSTWPDLGQALAQADRGNGTALLQLYDEYVERGPDGQYQNVDEAANAVSCADGDRASVSAIVAAAPAVEKAAPVVGLANLYSLLQCAVWPTAPTNHPHRITAPGSPPIVVVGSTGDPATPYAWAQSLARQLSNGVLLTRVGEGHTGYLFSSCVRTAVDTYLVSGQPPAKGTTCHSDR